MKGRVESARGSAGRRPGPAPRVREVGQYSTAEESWKAGRAVAGWLPPAGFFG